MRLLYSYLRRYWGLVLLALGLAAVNQVFSLLDPLIFRYVIDEYATRYQEYTTEQFFRGVSLLLAAAVGVAFVSRGMCLAPGEGRLSKGLFAAGKVPGTPGGGLA